MAAILPLLPAPAYALAAAALAFLLARAEPAVTPPLAILLGLVLFLFCAVAHLAVLGYRAERELRRACLWLRDRQDRIEREIVQARDEARQIEAAIAAAGRGGAGLREVVGEVKVLQKLVERLQAGAASPAPRPAAAPPPAPAAPAAAADPAPDPVPAAPPSGAPPEAAVAPEPDEAALLDLVREALGSGRVELFLQPIVSLPQRRRRFYECFTRIRTADGALIAPERYLDLAEREGLVAAIDNMLLFRCVQTVRKARQRNPQVGFFCNISRHSLADRDFFRDFVDFVRQNAELAPHLVLEMAAADLDAPETRAPELAALAALGLRFSLDRVTGLALDPAMLAERNVAFVKIDAPPPGAAPDPEWEAAVGRLRAALAPRGVQLVATRIETEPQLVELLEHGFAYGQGFLFGEPKPAPDA